MQSAHKGRKETAGRRENDIQIMKMQFEHLEQGFLEALDNLVAGTSKLDKSRFSEVFQEIKANPLHLIFVAMAEQGVQKKTVAGTITLLVEPKFIFNGGRVGHIEDVSVKKGYQKTGLGSRLVRHATKAAREMGCVKIVLDCSDDTMPFYEKLGYVYQDNCMKIILADSAQAQS